MSPIRVSLASTLSSDELEHYGILGMKWGVTRRRGADGLVAGSPLKAKKQQQAQNNKQQSNQNQSGNKSGSSPTDSSPAQPKTRKEQLREVKRLRGLMRKKPSELTDQDLKDLNARLQLEKQYKELSKPSKTVMDKVKDTLVDSATKGLGAFVVQQTKGKLDQYVAPEISKAIAAVFDYGKKKKGKSGGGSTASTSPVASPPASTP